MINKIFLSLVFTLIVSIYAIDANAQGESTGGVGTVIEAAPYENTHKTNKKADITGGIHIKNLVLDKKLDHSMGFDVINECAYFEIPVDNPRLCDALKEMTVNSLGLNRFQANRLSTQANLPSNSSNCYSLVGKLNGNIKEGYKFSDRERQATETCQLFCKRAPDTELSRSYCGVNDCLKPENQGATWCETVAKYWATKIEDPADNILASVYSAKSKYVENFLYCIKAYKVNNRLPSSQCCDKKVKNLITKYDPQNADATLAACNR